MKSVHRQYCWIITSVYTIYKLYTIYLVGRPVNLIVYVHAEYIHS